MDMSIEEVYLAAFKGSFISTMRWHDLDAFWDVLREHADDNWYIYAVGETPSPIILPLTPIITLLLLPPIMRNKHHHSQ